MTRPAAAFALAPILLAASLAACGNRVDLRPAAGENLPPAPLGRADAPTSEELLTRTPQQAPKRSVELRTRSEEREDDPFDLPPPDG